MRGLATIDDLSIGGDAIITNTSSYASLRKILKFSGLAVADNVAFMNDLIFNKGAFAGGVFAGDNFISSFGGVSILMNSGGIGANKGSNGRSYDPGYSSFTINLRSSSTSTTFDKRLFTVRQNGVMILCNDVWHITNDNIQVNSF